MYPLVKSLHVVAIISWMAGLLYLPRLFVYHSCSSLASDQSETFKLMERRLLNYIMNPSMLVAWLTGIYMALNAGFSSHNWFRFKLCFVVALTFFHCYLGVYVQRFSKDSNQRSARFFRVLNEIPTILMLFIVGLVILKP